MRVLATFLLIAALHPLGGCAVLGVGLPGLGGDDAAGMPTAGIARRAIARAQHSEAKLQAPEQALGADWPAAQSSLLVALAASEGSSSSWINPSNGSMGTIATKPAGAGPCRGFDVTVFRNGTSERLFGDACRKGRDWRFAGLSAVQASR